MRKRNLLKKFDNRFVEIMGNITTDIYEIGKDPNDFIYFREFYRNTIDKLIHIHQEAHNTWSHRKIDRLFDDMIDAKCDWSFLKNQYYKFINFKNGFVKESDSKEDE